MLGNGALLDLCSRRVIALRDVHAHPFRVTAWGFPGHSMGFPGNSMGFPGNSMGCQQPHGARPRDPGVGHGCGATATARSLQSPCGSPLPRFPGKPLPGKGIAILFQRLSAPPVKARLQGLPSRACQHRLAGSG